MPECSCIAITGKRVNREGARERLNAFQSGSNIQSWDCIAHLIKEKTKNRKPLSIYITVFFSI